MSIKKSDGSSLSFTQQGTVDWVGLGDKSFEASLNVLSRLSGANIDPFTFTVAQAISSQFQLSRDGKIRMKECLQALKCFASLEDVLWFGFGIKHVIRVLANTTHGVSTIAICGSLSEVLSTESAASILDELSEVYGAPSELRPSLSQWENLLCSCSGTLANTNFGLVAEHFMSLNGDSFITSRAPFILNPRIQPRQAGMPKHVAVVLAAIGNLSHGQLSSIEIRGGSMCGLLAAFGYWFLGLDVEIWTGSTLAYRSIAEGQPVQILVRYTATDVTIDSTEVELASKSYHIFNIASIIAPITDSEAEATLIMSGRIPWSSAITSTFKDVGRKLLKSHYNLGQVLGNAARIFAAFANAEPDAPHPGTGHVLSDEGWALATIHRSESFGDGLIDFMLKTLPELAALDANTMYACLKHPIARSVEEFQNAIERLASLCDCESCTPRPDMSRELHLTGIFCVPLVAEFLAITLRNLSLVHPDVELQPYRSGLETLYRNYELFANKKMANRAPGILRGTRMLDVYDTAELVYTGRQELFQGRKGVRGSEQRTGTPPVFSAHGMTFYLNVLRELSDCPGNAGLLRIVPGSITLQSNRVYTFVKDLAPAGGLSYPVTNYRPLASLSDLKILDTSSADLAAKLTIFESVGALSLEFSFTKGAHSLCQIGPTQLVKRLADSSYSVFCPRRLCQSDAKLTSVFTVEGEGKVDLEADFRASRLVVIR